MNEQSEQLPKPSPVQLPLNEPLETRGKTPVNPFLAWALLDENAPPPKQFSLESLMREEEIQRITPIVNERRKIIIYGNNGYGKTTLVKELIACLQAQSRSFQFLDHTDFRSLKRMKGWHDLLRFASVATENPPVTILDSADYLWEKTEDTNLAQARAAFLKDLLHSDYPVVVTSHQNEPQGKTTDWEALKQFRRIISGCQSLELLETMDLQPHYSRQKVRDFFQRLGFDFEVAEIMIDSSPYSTNHAILKNYFIPEWREKAFHPYFNNIYRTHGLDLLKETTQQIFAKYKPASRQYQ